MTNKKWANRERGLMFYGKGGDVYGSEFYIQDGSWAMFSGVRIYARNSSNEKEEICLSLKLDGAKKLIKGLQRFVLEKDK